MNKQFFPPSPECPNFGSGPSRKFPGWNAALLSTEAIGRSHRSPVGLSKIKSLIAKLRNVLQIPRTHHIALVNGGTTGAFEFLLWNLLNEKHPVDVFSMGVFGDLWYRDIATELKIPDVQHFSASVGQIPDFRQYDNQRDCIFVWTETTAGTTVPHSIKDGQRYPDISWIPSSRTGLTICDVTSAVFCTPIVWKALDAAAFSLQKGLGAEAGLGIVVMNDRALQRCDQNFKTHDHFYRPMSRLFRLPRIDEDIDMQFFEGNTINTISLLIVEDALQALTWAENLETDEQSSLTRLIQRVETNYAVADSFIQMHDWITYLVKDLNVRSHNVVCLQLNHNEKLPELAKFLADHHAGFDILNHAKSVPALRLWLGPCIDSQDIAKFLQWLELAYHSFAFGS